jgi:hypothetical protein
MWQFGSGAVGEWGSWRVGSRGVGQSAFGKVGGGGGCSSWEWASRAAWQLGEWDNWRVWELRSGTVGCLTGCENITVHYKMVCVTKRYILQNGMCYKTVHVTKW